MPPKRKASQPPAFIFKPPPDGDVTLKSSDGTVFIAHSVFLKFSSKVFSDMLGNSTTADVVELAEDAEAVSLMLAFVYPAMRPPIDTVALLEKAMIAANKYEIDVLSQTIEQTVGQQRDLIRQDPLRIHRVARVCGFPSVELISAKLIARNHYDLNSIDGVVKFAKDFPESSRGIGLIGAQVAKTRILHQLFEEKMDVSEPPGSLTPSWPAGFVCKECRRGKHNDVPGWYYLWAKQLHSALANKLPDECDSFFKREYLEKLGSNGGCGPCVAIMSGPNGSFFDRWANDSRKLIKHEFAKLDVLYTL